jgi:hypothetical protein
MTRKLCLFIIVVLSAALLAAGVSANEKKAKPTALKIGFDQSYSPLSGYTLSSKFSKLKTYLENEFGADVSANSSGWTTSKLNKFDIYIIPGGCKSIPPAEAISALKTWVQNGGKLLFLWHWMGFNYQATYWHAGVQLHDKILEHFGMQIKGTDAGGTRIVNFSGPFGTTPYNVDTVLGGAKASWMHSATGSAKFLGWNSNGNPVASYNPKAGKGKLILIGNEHNFQNSRIDLADNEKFLYNLIHYLGGNGGGTGGAKSDLMVKFVKAREKVLSPGDQITLITRIKNKSKNPTPASSVRFYLSPDKELSASDKLIDEAVVPPLGKRKGKKIKKIFILPMSLGDGMYYIIAIVDEDEQIKDKNRDNNAKASNKKIEIM